jgi:hypothetical protein
MTLRLNATGSSQPYVTLNTSYNSQGEKEVSFDPKTVSWEELAKLYADDDLLRTLFSMMGEWSKSSPFDYFLRLDPTWTGTGTWTGTFTTTTGTSSGTYGIGGTSLTTKPTTSGASISGNDHGGNNLTYEAVDATSVINDIKLAGVSISAPTDGPISASMNFRSIRDDKA